MAKNEPGDLSPEISESNSPELHLPNELPAREETEPSLSNSSITLNDEKHHWVKKLDFLIADQWFLIVLGILILISSQVQVPASQQAVKSTVIAYLCVAVSFFIFGCTISTRTLIDNYSKWKVHLFVQLQCFLLTSAVVFGIVCAAATNKDFMDPWLLIGIICTSSVPTALSSNVFMTRKADGNTALTVVEATIGNSLKPFITPLLVRMYTGTGAWWTEVLPADRGSYGEIYRRVFHQLCLSIFLPMFVGQVIQNLFPKPTKRIFIDWRVGKLGAFSLLIIIWQTFDQAFEADAFSDVKPNNLIFVVFISIAYFVSWLMICFLASVWWLSRKDTVAVAYCVPAKTPALGVPLANLIFVGLSRLETSKIQVPMVVFQGIQIFLSSLLIPVFRKWVTQDAIEDAEKGVGEHRPGSGDSDVTLM